jgi:hypothetical protein
MARQGAVYGDRSRSNQNVTERTVDVCEPLTNEIEVLEEQIAVLEEGLPRAPGMQRAALAKEISAFQETLNARRQALYRCRTARA